jgi:sulfite exporter TauE/SafE
MTSGAAAPALVFVWGLVGGFSHCIGMCGVFVIACGAAAKGPRVLPHLLFHSGRLLSLLTLGMIAGALGSIDHRWAAAQSAVSIGAGVVMLGLALGFAGVVPWLRIPEPDVLGAGGGLGRRLFVRALRSEHPLRAGLIGLFVGLLPCGLTYQALIPAAVSGSAARGALTMALFGIGGMPGLLTLALLAQTPLGKILSNTPLRQRMTLVSAAVMAVLGIVFFWRGVVGA